MTERGHETRGPTIREDSIGLSVIVSTKDRPDLVLILLEALSDQTVTPDEVIVVDGGEGGDLAAALKQYEDVIYLHRPDDRGAAHARNIGMDASEGDILVFLDDDVIPDPTFLEVLLGAYRAHPQVGGVGGVPVSEEPPTVVRRAFLRIFQLGPFADPTAFHQASADGSPEEVTRLSGCAMSLRRELAIEHRFDENLERYSLGEDMDLSWRASADRPLLLVPQARVKHEGLGWESLDLSRRFEGKILSYSYHYLKNLRGRLRYRLAFAWLAFGIVGEAFIYTLLKRTLSPLEGLGRGLRAWITTMDGAGGFIGQDPRGRADPQAEKEP